MKNFYEITYKDCNKETRVMGVAAETMSSAVRMFEEYMEEFLVTTYGVDIEIISCHVISQYSNMVLV